MDKIRPRGFIIRKTKLLGRKPNTLGCWTYSITLLVTKGTQRKMWSEKKMELNNFGGFAVKSSESHLFDYNNLTILSTKGSIPNPPTEAPQWQNVCATANLSHRSLGPKNRGKRKHLSRCRFPRSSQELPKWPRFLTVGFKILTVAFYRL
jgi:hypothetical protein